MLIRTNVTNIGDPFILYHEGVYYMYTTTFDAKGFRYYISENLENWTDGGLALDLSDGWACKDFWAPEVICRPGDGKYVMHFTARRKADQSLRIGVAVADSPQGPFRQLTDAPMFDFGYAAIDGHAFIDEDGKAYFYYSRDCSENLIDGKNISQIYVVSLDETLTQVTGKPVLLATPTYSYECQGCGHWCWNEGASVLKKDGKYYLFYSANNFATKAYCINLAVADTPTGAFAKMNGQNPILHCDMQKQDFSGPGHNAFFTDRDGHLKTVFHIHTDEAHPGDDRKAVIADVAFENGCWKIIL